MRIHALALVPSRRARSVAHAALLAGAVLCANAGAYAAMEIGFETVYGEAKTLVGLEQAWINPAGPLRVRVAAELGAVVTAALHTQEGAVASQTVSARLDRDDWVAFDAVSMIGAVLSLPLPPVDGPYRLSVQTRNANDAVIATTLGDVGIDRQAPTMTGAWRYRGGASGWIEFSQGDEIDWSEGAEIVAAGITDGASGIGSVRAFTVTDEAGEVDADYDPVTGTAWVTRLALDYPKAVQADADPPARVGFVVADAAGNYARFVRSATFTRGEGGVSHPSKGSGILGLAVHLDGGTTQAWQGPAGSTDPAVVRLGADARITAATLRVAAQEVARTATLGEAQCALPAGATQCTLDLVLEPQGAGGDGLHRLVATVQGADHDGPALSQEVVLIRDRILPDIVGHAFVDDGHTLLLEIAEPSTGGLGGLSEVLVEAQGEDGQVVTLDGQWSREVGERYRGRVALNALADGRYRLTAYVRDAAGQRARGRVIEAYVRARTPPRIGLRYGSAALQGQRISSFGTLRVVLDDDARLTSLILRGGPDATTIGLTGFALADGIRPGFVPLRPSSAAGDYILTAIATDAQGNQSRQEASFTYAPAPDLLARVEEGSGAVVSSEGAGGSMLRTMPLTRWWSAGAALGGTHDVSVFLSPDAQGSVRVGSLVLGPGERGVIEDYDFQDADHRIALPIAPVDDAGVAGILLLRTDQEDVPGIAVAVSLVAANSAQGQGDGIAQTGSKPMRQTRIDARIAVHGGAADARIDEAATFTLMDSNGAPLSGNWSAWHPQSGTLLRLGEGLSQIAPHLPEEGDWVVEATPGGQGIAIANVLRVFDEPPPRLRIEGPEAVQIGKAARFLAGGVRPGRSAWWVHWQLPDGTTAEGASVDYVPREGDPGLVLAARRTSDDAAVTATATPRLWSYAWPRFALTSKDAGGGDRRVRHYAVTTREVFMTGAEPLQYAWEFPPGTVAKGSGALQMITWRSGVEPWARVTVSNSRGDATVLSDIDTDTDTDAELALSLSVDTQDRFARAPTRASVSWTVSGLRKAERIVSALFWSNGAHVGSSLGEPLSIAMPSPGARRIDAEILTDQGRRVRTSSVVEVYDGDPPVCRVGLSGDWTLYLEAIADCAVARGELRGYRWSIVYADDGSVRDFGVRDGRLLIESAHLKRGVSEIRLIGYDDRGVASREVKRRRRDGAARR